MDRVLASRRGIAQVRGQRLLGVSGGLRASLPGAGADQEGEELEGKCTREARGLGGYARIGCADASKGTAKAVPEDVSESTAGVPEVSSLHWRVG